MPKAAVNSADIRRRLRGPDAAPTPTADAPADAIPEPNRRPDDVTNRTPLPNDLLAGIEKLRAENQDLRALIEQAITQEEENERRVRDAMEREQSLVGQLDVQTRQRQAYLEQLESLQNGGEASALVAQVSERDEIIRTLTEQVQLLDAQIQLSQETAGDRDQFMQGIRERDEHIDVLQARVTELERHIAEIPPPPPTDEELARMADELEKERCQMIQLRKDLEDEKRQHREDEADFERQMREMEVQMSKERAEMARQRMELQRLQAEVRSDLDSAQRGDAVLKDKLAAFQRRQAEPAAPATPRGAAPAPATGPSKMDKDSGFMRRFFGNK